jgi:hypothetical protein
MFIIRHNILILLFIHFSGFFQFYFKFTLTTFWQGIYFMLINVEMPTKGFINVQ